MYVAIKELYFGPFNLGEEGLCISKGDVWMLEQITCGGRVWLKKQHDSDSVLQITQEQLESDFVEVNLKDVNMDTIYVFDDDECTKTIMLNGYEIESDTFSWAFDDFCEFMGYPLSEWIH